MSKKSKQFETDLFRHVLNSLSQFDFPQQNLCQCHVYNRNTNAIENEPTVPTQLYPHMRKVYNDETDRLEQVHITMSTVKPEQEIVNQQKSQRRRARISKQRAEVLITEYCKRNIVNKLKASRKKRNYSSFLH